MTGSLSKKRRENNGRLNDKVKYCNHNNILVLRLLQLVVVVVVVILLIILVLLLVLLLLLPTYGYASVSGAWARENAGEHHDEEGCGSRDVLITLISLKRCQGGGKASGSGRLCGHLGGRRGDHENHRDSTCRNEWNVSGCEAANGGVESASGDVYHYEEGCGCREN